ncbi:unnamed protein product, partial [Porites evermanni]
MATLLLDIQSSVPAVPRPIEPANIHRCDMVSQGGGTPKFGYLTVCRLCSAINLPSFYPNEIVDLLIESKGKDRKERWKEFLKYVDENNQHYDPRMISTDVVDFLC